jgi:hypothetical protein
MQYFSHAQTRKTVGRKLSAALSASLVIYQLGSCSAYLIIIGDTISPLLQHGFGEDAFFAGRQFVIIFFAIFIIMPLCFPRQAITTPPLSHPPLCDSPSDSQSFKAIGATASIDCKAHSLHAHTSD